MKNSENFRNKSYLLGNLKAGKNNIDDDVYSLFEKHDAERLVIAFNLWEDRFLDFLEETVPRLVGSYETQTSKFIPIIYHGASLINFKTSKSNKVEAFLTQCITDARKGNLDNYYIGSTIKKLGLHGSPENKYLLPKIIRFIFISLPTAIGRLFFDVLGKGDKAARSSAIIVGYIVITVLVLLLLRVLSPSILVDIYRFFFPEPK